jgi:hypothetical protein
VAWQILRVVACHALDFDARVVPACLTMPLAHELERSATDAVESILGTLLPTTAAAQLYLPTRCAGMGFSSPVHTAALARCANVVERGPVLRATVQDWGHTAAEAGTVDGADDAPTDLAAHLVVHGIQGLTADGRPSALGGLTSAGFRPLLPQKHLLSHYLRYAADGALGTLLDTADTETAARLRSSSGPTAGRLFTADMNHESLHLQDTVWCVAAKWRLGLPVCPATPCSLLTGDGRSCGSCGDRAGRHAVSCPHGPLVNLRHRRVGEAWTHVFQEAGAVVRSEVYMADMRTSAGTDAVLDLLTLGPESLDQLWMDVTVRHPLDVRYLARAAAADGACNLQAERDKTLKYPARGGWSVSPLAHETFGRLGDTAESILLMADVAAKRADALAGRASSSRCRRWRALLDAAVHVGVAHQLLAASAGPLGVRPTTGHGAVDLEFLELGRPR